MMPLSMVNEGEPQVIKKVGGKEETRKFLENLGFVQGATVTVVSEISGNMIVNVKDSRVAIGKDMAAFDSRVKDAVAKATAEAAIKSGVARI